MGIYIEAIEPKMDCRKDTMWRPSRAHDSRSPDLTSLLFLPAELKPKERHKKPRID